MIATGTAVSTVLLTIVTAVKILPTSSESHEGTAVPVCGV